MKRRTTFITIFILAILSIYGTIDLNNLDNYANQSVPNYITKDNTGNNPITDEGATLGRVLFYDKKLSSNNTVSCASCHIQEFAFGDTALVSQGVNGVTGRHSMRLVNSRFAEETNFFWDERADSLEMQTTMPIRDHGEMGYSGTNGDPTFADLLVELNNTDYYNPLFLQVFGDTLVTEDRMQKALSQFVRSIQSFDAKYDVGRAQVSHDTLPFPNFNANENAGKSLFLTPAQFNQSGVRIGGGAGCALCHRAPEFDIDPNSLNNGIIFTPNGPGPGNPLDTGITRSPTLRDMINPNGVLNGGLMHNGSFSLAGAVIHYNNIPQFNNLPNPPQIDPRLRPNGNSQDLNLTPNERLQITLFLRTLTGSDVYTNPKWSNPFDANGNISVIGGVPTKIVESDFEINLFPNPVVNTLTLEGELQGLNITLISTNGQLLEQRTLNSDNERLDFSSLSNGVYFVRLQSVDGQSVVKKVVKY